MSHALVTTAAYLLLVDLETHHVTPIEGGREEYYGVSWFPGGRDLVLSHSGLNNSDLIDLASYAQSERGWISSASGNTLPFLSAPHQILCTHDHKVICTNTGRNAVTVVDLERPKHYQEQRISSARWDRLGLDQITGDHLNSVFLQDNRLYVLAHGHQGGSRLATLSYPDLDLITIEILENRTGLHNIWITSEGQRISCNSNVGTLIDLDSVGPIWESGAEIFTRGLAATVDYVVIGESRRTGRDLRRSSLGGLWIIDRKSWTTMDYICLGPYGAVHEVRIVDESDEAHHGWIFEGFKALLSRDMRQEVALDRLQASRRVALTARLWSEYDFIYGAPQILEDGSKRASANGLCLALRKQSHPRPMEQLVTFSIDFVFTESPAHLSVVVGYHGAGNDKNMVALLIQPTGDESSLSLWRHDGSGWDWDRGFTGRSGLPLRGTLSVKAQKSRLCIGFSSGMQIEVDQTTLRTDNCASFEFRVGDAGSGVPGRWGQGRAQPGAANP